MGCFVQWMMNSQEKYEFINTCKTGKWIISELEMNIDKCNDKNDKNVFF